MNFRTYISAWLFAVVPFSLPAQSPLEAMSPVVTFDFTPADIVDIAPPKAREKRPNAWAVIIGNQDYEYADDVEFALNDAQVMKKYLIESFGYDENRILVEKNIGLDQFNTLFGAAAGNTGQLHDLVRPGDEVFVYYSGHGAPDYGSKISYLVPVKANPKYIKGAGYPLDVLYENLAKLPASSIVVAIDACFSGAGVIKDQAPLGVKAPEKLVSLTNGLVFSACKETEPANFYRAKKHGMFTYAFLLAIQTLGKTDKDVSVQEIFERIAADAEGGIPYLCRKEGGVHTQQHPQLLGGGDRNRTWIKLK
jgi:hypothetical protein